jgi:hypothetical protein
MFFELSSSGLNVLLDIDCPIHLVCIRKDAHGCKFRMGTCAIDWRILFQSEENDCHSVSIDDVYNL